MHVNCNCLIDNVYVFTVSSATELFLLKMNDFKRVKEEYSDKLKGFASYTECMTRALFTGVASFALTFSALYFTQYLLKSRLPYQQKHFMVLPAVTSTGIAWIVTSRRAQVCQQNWTSGVDQYTDYGLKSSKEI